MILLFSTAYLVFYSRAKAFWGDEALTFYTVHHRSLAGLLRFQLTTPIVLEPPTHDILLWAVTQMFGYSKWAFRIPSILFFLSTQWLLYRITTVLGGRRAGLLAAAGLLGTLFVSYGAEARPYAFLTALTMASLVLWHRAHTCSRHPEVIVLALGITMALATTSQFLGAMVIFPIAVAEAVLSLGEHRKPKLGVMLALLIGMVSVLLDLPFAHAVRPYRPPSAYRMNIGEDQFAATYEWGLIRAPRLLNEWRFGQDVFVAVLLFLAIFGSFPRSRPSSRVAGSLPMRQAVWASLVALTFYPVPALTIAYFATHYYAPRYAIPCIAGIVGLLAATLARFSRRLRQSGVYVSTILLILAVVFRCRTMLRDQKVTTSIVANKYRASAPVRSFLSAYPSLPVYLTTDECLLYPFFGEPLYKSRIRCLYSMPLEMRYDRSTMSSLTQRVIAQNTDIALPAATYTQMQKEGTAVLVYDPRPWLGWIPAALKADDASIAKIGLGLGGEASVVSFPRTNTLP